MKKQDFEVIEYDWAIGFLLHKIAPFRDMYKKHYIKHPEVATDKDIEIIEKQLEMMLNMVGWMFGDYVALFKEKQDGKVTAFFAWECVKQ